MTGPDLIEQLLAEGFVVSRRSKTLVWLARGGEQLLVDSEAEVADGLAQEILTRARKSGKPPP